jgi:endonuclease/exonuclease/phosphatase family metal-dependent hydrolase
MRILSWNIQWGRGIDGRVDLARIAREIRRNGDFDVICLQEVAVNFPGLAGSHGEDQVAALTQLFAGYDSHYAAATDLPAANGRRNLYGNLLLSRLPVGQVFRHLLPWPADPAVASMQRVLLEAVIRTPRGALRVMTTHLEYYSAKIRAAQIDAIRALHAEASTHARMPRHGEGEEGGSVEVLARPAAAVLCGDMNFAAGAPVPAQLLQPYLDETEDWHDSHEVLQPGRTHAPTVGLHQPSFMKAPRCFDFMFVTTGLTPRLKRHAVDAATTASDHQPVWLELADD